jgi:hypothetical protein
MSGIKQHTIFGVTRIRADFADPIGNERNPVGTAFFLETQDGHNVLVTNRHNLDPRLKFGADTNFRLARLEVELRAIVPSSGPIADAIDVAKAETRFFQVTELSARVFVSPTADCAFVADPVWPDREEPYAGLPVFKESELADETYFREQLRVMDAASFIGFPGSAGRHWWDEHWRLPIARPASIASWPAVPFTNAQIQTADTLLVAGHSFTGSSGSPVVAHSKGVLSSSVPARVIGIMSGHFDNREETPEMFRHSGLSYLTRSTSILALLAEARAVGFRRPVPVDGLFPTAAVGTFPGGDTGDTSTDA